MNRESDRAAAAARRPLDRLIPKAGTAALALPFLVGLAAIAVLAVPAFAADAEPDIDAFWEYSDANASEARFRSALGAASGDRRLELLTQVARTYSLRRRFSEAHALLDQIEPELRHAGPAPRVRHLLERGRTFNSAGEPQRALPLFERAWTVARESRLDGLAVDAAHMAAIVSGVDDAGRWTDAALALARGSSDAKARGLIPALLNNRAWSLHDAKRFEEALPLFRAAEVEWRSTGRQPQGRIATWSVARCLRSLRRYDEALALQMALEREWAAAGAEDGYVFEEIAELLDAMGRIDEARPWFRRALERLASDARLAAREPARLARLRDKSG